MKTQLNKSDYIILGIYFTIVIISNVYDYSVRGNKLIEFLADIPSTVLNIILLIYIFMYWLIPNYIINKRKYFFFAFWGLFWMTVIGILDYTIGFWSGDNDWAKYPSSIFSLINNSIARSADNMGLPFGLLLAKKYYENQIQYTKVQEQQKENELKLLRSQLDPHFLFNNLNTLDALIDSNPNKAKAYINRLSLIYRYLIHTKDAEVMELSEELGLAENYIFLIKTRFGNDYEFDIHTNTSLKDKFIPTGAIQTLIENVAKHNKVQQQKTVKTTIVIDDDSLSITNTKTGIQSNRESLGTGLKNLEYRYAILSDRKPVIEDSETHFKVTIPIIKLSDES